MPKGLAVVRTNGRVVVAIRDVSELQFNIHELRGPFRRTIGPFLMERIPGCCVHSVLNHRLGTGPMRHQNRLMLRMYSTTLAMYLLPPRAAVAAPLLAGSD